MTTFKKLLAACAVAGLATLGLATPVNADSQASTTAMDAEPEADISAQCPTTLEPIVRGGQAEWTLECVDGNVRVYGWVEDTRPDGRCAHANFSSDGRSLTTSACGAGERETFSYTFLNTNSVYGQLTVQ